MATMRAAVYTAFSGAIQIQEASTHNPLGMPLACDCQVLPSTSLYLDSYFDCQVRQFAGSKADSTSRRPSTPSEGASF